ncbi:TPR end-of-group domain-containing protein [Argonema galeatum]|uniref:TPR end-of-group domain-containing protein n=1 Tax=Argonema galeatum TaxID=2942762 RepID=UPI002013773E|nr:tetratricopeptide repeat protein [Argonema galeatum]MCL1464589.1 tetratricopeptide repeat protein [Argonema galeatum A003/A1]
MKINYWITCAILSVGLKVFAAPTPPQPIFSAQLKPASEISQTEREELQQLRQDKEIRDRVQTEVDRAFSRATTLINILLFVMTLFPFATALGVWLLRRSAIDQIVSETRNELEKEVQKQLEAEVADEFKKQASAFQQEMQKLEAEFGSHLDQLQALFIDGNTEEKNNLNEQQIESFSLQAAPQIPTLAEPQIETPQAENEEKISANPGEVLSVDEYLEQGNVHFAEGRYAEANNCYNQALKIERDFPETRYQNARAYARRRNINPAIGNLQWAIDIEPMYKEKAKIDSAFDEMRENEQFQKLVDE